MAKKTSQLDNRRLVTDDDLASMREVWFKQGQLHSEPSEKTRELFERVADKLESLSVSQEAVKTSLTFIIERVEKIEEKLNKSDERCRICATKFVSKEDMASQKEEIKKSLNEHDTRIENIEKLIQTIQKSVNYGVVKIVLGVSLVTIIINIRQILEYFSK